MTAKFTGISFTDPKMSALSAAQKFARETWAEPRDIESWNGFRFLMMDGVTWCEVRRVPGGWEIWQLED